MLAEARAKNLLNTDAAMIQRCAELADDLIPRSPTSRQDARSWNWEVT